MPKRLLMLAMATALVLGATPGPLAASASCSHIYVFLGFARVFSQGMYKLSRRLSQAGYTVSVHSWTAGGSVAGRIRRQYARNQCSIVLIGHSSGGETTVSVADALAKDDIPVSLLISYDASARMKVGSNVRRAISYYVPSIGKPIGRMAGSGGVIENHNLAGRANLNHFSIDSSDAVHDMAVNAVRHALGR